MRQHGDGLWARALNLLLAGWLLVSTFAWEHGATRENSALVGYLCSVAAIAAMAIPGARRITTLLSIWLFTSSLSLPHAHAAAGWNDALVAVMMFALSLVPSSHPPVSTERLAS